MMQKYESLLSEIQQITSCFYISDLRIIRPNQNICTLIALIPDKKYPLSEWNEAISYISGRKLNFSSVKEAKHFFHTLT